jgi:hypothetical protein
MATGEECDELPQIDDAVVVGVHAVPPVGPSFSQ